VRLPVLGALTGCAGAAPMPGSIGGPWRCVSGTGTGWRLEAGSISNCGSDDHSLLTARRIHTKEAMRIRPR
jgi:hypothetical protein